MRLRLQNLQRIHKQLIMAFVDIFTLVLALWLAFVLRLGDPLPLDYIFSSWWIFTLPFITIFLFIKLGLYRAVLQYIGIKIILTTFQATTIACLIVGFFMMFFENQISLDQFFPFFGFIINIFVITSRFLFKAYLYSWDSFISLRKKTLIYGAGDAGVQLVESLKKSSIYLPIAFIDDDTTKQGTIINHLEVFPFNKIDTLIKNEDVKVLLFAVPSVNIKQKNSNSEKVNKVSIEVKLLPSIDSVSNGVVSIDNIKHVEVGDILGRNVVSPKKNYYKEIFQKKKYFNNWRRR